MSSNIPNVIWEDQCRPFLGLPLSFTKYSLTADRLFIQSGFLNIREDEVRLYRIMDLSLSMSLFQRLFGVGTIHCYSADQSMKDFDIKNIRNARDVKALLSETVERERMNKYVLNREFMEHMAKDAYDDSYAHHHF